MRCFVLSISRFLAVLSLALTLTACGGGGGDSSTSTTPVTPGDPGTPTAPKATFTAPASASANQVVVFDASSSTSPDGSALTYVWDFGDGLRGGGKTIARSFGAGGARSVTLTVIDGGGRSGSASRTLTVAAPTAGSSVTVAGRITGTDGSPLSGVSVARVGASSSTPATSDATGKASLAVPRATAVTLRLSKTGYADQFVHLNLPASTGSDGYFEAILGPRDVALTLADAAVGGTLTGRDGAGITVPANAFVDSSGAPVTGAIQISVTPVDATQSGGGGFPGEFAGIQPDGTTTPIVSFGAVEYIPTSSAGKLQLAPGKTATIEVPIYGARRPDGTVIAVGDVIPLWSLDETTSMWIQEGTGQAVASASSPSGLAMRATVSHLSWWNADLGFEPYGPEPDCRAASDIGIPEALDSFANASICVMLAEAERTLSGARVRPQADPPAARFAGYRRGATVPMGGGTPVPVPPGMDIRLTASALNGTWSGTKVVRGAVGVRERVVVEMRPNSTGGSGSEPELVTTPFDAIRTMPVGRTDARYRFTANTAQWINITVSTGDINSNLAGNVRLLQGTTELGRANFGLGTVRMLVPANGSYVVVVTGEQNIPGGYHIKIETPSSQINEALAYPFAVTKDLPIFTRYHGSFTHGGTAAYFGLRSEQPIGSVSLRVLDANGAVVAHAGSTNTALAQTVVSLPAGGYTAEVAVPDGTAGRASLRGEPTSWLPVAEIAPVTANTYRGMIDLVADRNGRPVIGYWDTDLSSQTRAAFIHLRRWTGSAWETVGTDASFTVGNGYCITRSGISIPRPRLASFAFDANNNPVIAYRVDQETSFPNSVSTTTVRSFTGGSWQAVGPNDGKLPLTANNGEFCDDAPLVGVDAVNQPVVAYRSTSGVTVQRYDGTAWKGLGNATADSFADAGSQRGGFALGFDATRQAYLASTGETSVVVRRFNAQSSSWETVGPNSGTIDVGNARSFTGGRFAFDASGQPTLALYTIVPTPAAPSGGYAPVVYRYNGTAWTGNLYPSVATQGAVPFQENVAIAASGSDTWVAWPQGLNGTAYSPVVHRQNGSTWTPVGAGIGEIPQFTQRFTNTLNHATSPVLLQNADGLYLATLLRDVNGYKLVLSRKVD